MSRSLTRKVVWGGAACLALVTYDVLSGFRRGWSIESFLKDALLIALLVYEVWRERRYYRRLREMSEPERGQQLAQLLPEQRAKILLKLKEYET